MAAASRCFPSCTVQATARHRVMASYAVAPDRVAPWLPSGLVPDTWKERACVTLEGVQWVAVRVLGLVGLGIRRVPTVTLQVLVREEQSPLVRRGWWIVQTHVPRRLLGWGMQFLYGEPAAVTAIQPVRRERSERIEMTYCFDSAGREQRLRVLGRKPPVMPAPDTYAYFLMDRTCRYGTARGGNLLRTRLERPKEAMYRVQEQYVTVRWASVYGEEWSFLENREPTVVLFSPGGPVTAQWPEHIT